MPGFFDKMKEAAGKAAFEAEKQTRLVQAQMELKNLDKRVDEALLALGRSVMELYDQGTLGHPGLEALCEGVVAQRQSARDQQQKIEAMREERAPAPQAAPAQGPAAPVATPQPVAEVTEAPAAAQPPAAEAPAQAAPAPEGSFCPQCGAALLPSARFCGECGARL